MNLSDVPIGAFFTFSETWPFILQRIEDRLGYREFLAYERDGKYHGPVMIPFLTGDVIPVVIEFVFPVATHVHDQA